MADIIKVVKVRINYEKGSQMISGCDPAASNTALFAGVTAMDGLGEKASTGFTKLMEADLKNA